MNTILLRWLDAARRRHREKVLVRQLLLLNDHLLADAGLRRDQLQPDGIHQLDLPAAPRPRRPAGAHGGARTLARPSLQGCG